MTAPDELLVLDGVDVRLGGAVVLDGVDLAVREGTVTVVVGHSGSGKSTLLRLCNRLVVPSAGTVRFRGRNLAGLSPDATRQLRRDVGMVFQRPVTFPGSVRDNLAVASPELGEDALVAALRDAALDASMLDRDVDTLSGGEAQRVCLARTLVTRPAVLLADEPTSALDPDATATLEELIGRLVGDGMTVVWVTHDHEQARRIATDVVELERGRVQRAARLARDGPIDDRTTGGR